MKKVFKGILIIGFIFYPFLAGYCLAEGQYVWVGLLLITLGCLKLFSKGNALLLPLTTFAILCGALSLILKDEAWLKLYPVFMSLGALIIFALTLIKPPSMIERFARIVEPDLPHEGVIWTKKVTMVWCLFFLCNSLIATYTVFMTSMEIWVLYNGFISYFLMGILFVVEFILRKRQQRKHQL
ncbi:septation protein IspZ [Acinetobacter equi]|uniref:Clp protease n=1 Tax=Acinetobacter equi TaxID=1324350 RepID=A0A0N9W2E4_9GAMM|nr:septation protein IspZ [Acinetobacter equi]ALH95181.1 Clp protease [Acinetobacter equi]